MFLESWIRYLRVSLLVLVFSHLYFFSFAIRFVVFRGRLVSRSLWCLSWCFSLPDV